MLKFNCKIHYKFLIIIFLFSNTGIAQISSIPPAMLSQISMMSESDKRNLAKEYGIDIGSSLIGGNSGSDNTLGESSGEVVSDADLILLERILDSEENKIKAKKYKKDNLPIFETSKESLDELPVYGQFLFNEDFSTFQPVDNAPVPSDYVIGTGDSLRIMMFGNQDSNFELVVNREGEINFPEIGNISLLGMTFQEASSLIKSRVTSQMIGVDISISMGRLKSINVFMAGEARVPGSYSISSLSSVTQSLFVAGGITEIGSLRNIQVKRSGKIISNFDLYDLLIHGNSDGDIRLQSGDIVFVPVADKLVYVDGAVRRPGRYELLAEEAISDLIFMSGGFKSRAYLNQIYLESYSGKGLPQISNIDFTNSDNTNYTLNDGDIVKVAEISDTLSNSIKLKGAVKRPGNYGWYNGIRFADMIESIDTDFLENFDITKGLIIRRKNNQNFDIELIDFNIKEALMKPDSNFNPLLNLHDEILIFSKGHNDDSLNDIEFYNPREDMNHPKYFSQTQSSDSMTPNSPSPSTETGNFMNSDPEFLDNSIPIEMTEEELEVSIYETKKRKEYDFRNQGKRKALLEPIIKKLYQQASSSDSAKIVSISGAVKVPGEYPLTIDATYSDLIQLAGGYSDNAYDESAELRRKLLGNDGELVINVFDVDLDKAINAKLQSRDHLHIRNIKDWDAKDSVILKGEVFYPGEYLISPNETLSSVIRRAGGFTAESFIEGAIFTRESIKEKEREQLKILGDAIRRDQASRSMTKESEDFSISSSEVEAGITALLSSEVYGRLIIDIQGLIGGDVREDIVLQDGDILDIPKFTNAITVVGEVRRSGSFVRQDNFKIDDYLQLAAGMTARGDSDEIYIIRADGSVNKGGGRSSYLSFDGIENEILAGDTIVVPIKSSYQTPLNLYSTVSQVVFQSIASIAAFSSVFN